MGINKLIIMLRLVPALGFGLLALVAVAGTAPPALKPGAAPGAVDIATFKRALDQAPESMLLVDVRTPEEFRDEGSLKGAINIPLAELPDRLSTLPADKPIVFFCGSGMRSGRAYRLVKKRRPQLEVYYLRAYVKCGKDGSYTIQPRKE
jgi:rhodanese-related sulfurtransferase